MTANRFGQISTMLAALAIGATGTIGLANAHSPRDPSAVGDINKMVANSNFVFHGKVKQVVYRNASVAGGGSVPFTFVTYQVDDTLLGSARAQITMRFIGGADGRGGFVSVEGVPAFFPGDEDIMFVASNGESGCALVQCEFGRYRVLHGAVYEAHGSPVLGIAGNRISTGGAGPDELEAVRYPAPSFDDLIKNPDAAAQIKKMGMTVDQARARYNAEAPKTITTGTSHGGEAAKVVPVPGMALTAVMTSLKTAIGAAPRRPLTALADANPDQGLPALKVQAATPPN